MLLARLLCLLSVAASLGCGELSADGPSLSKQRRSPLRPGDRVPSASEQAVVGALQSRVLRNSPRFRKLVRCESKSIVFKDEERSGSDHMMSARLCQRLRRLAAQTERRWPGVRLRVTEAWDENGEHSGASVHYEGRAADVTTSDMDPRKLGELARLAVDVGIDWVYFENSSHVHLSVKRE